MALSSCSVICQGASNRNLATGGLKKEEFYMWFTQHQVTTDTTQEFWCALFVHTLYYTEKNFKITKWVFFSTFSNDYINYHFVWVTKWNLNIIKDHITFKQHLRNIVTERLHWELCTHIKEYWGFSNPFFRKSFQSLM